MAVSRWRHGKPESEAIGLMQQQLAAAGYADRVTWNGNTFSAAVGMGGMLLSLNGRVTNDEAVLERCAGLGGQIALADDPQHPAALVPRRRSEVVRARKPKRP